MRDRRDDMMKFASKITTEYADPEKWIKAFTDQKAGEGMKAARNAVRCTLTQAAALTGTRIGLIRAMESGDVVPSYDVYEKYMEKME